MACYDGPNPVKDEERQAIWKWAKANGINDKGEVVPGGIDKGLPMEKVGDSINKYFFGGQAKPEWITDILSGRKTPFRQVADDAWRAQYNRRAIVQQAQDTSRLASMGPAAKALRTLWTAPRSVAVAGHGFVFPITHAGDLAFRPASWGTFMHGLFNTYRGAFSPAYTGRMLDYMQRRALFTTALRSGLDVGAKSHPSGLLANKFGTGMANRAWDMLTTMRYELWEKQMQKFIDPSMSHEEVLEVGKSLANWANHATGSAEGPVAKLGGALFGPKLTQSKLSRLTVDPAKTIATFANWNGATPGEKAVALTRLSGATQYLLTGLGFLAVNQGLNMALKTGQNVNFTNPTRGDFLQFKGGGLEAYIPGLHTEIRTVGKILATAFMNSKQLRGDSRQAAAAKILGEYGMAKLTPAIQRGQEVLFSQNWMGRPVPWASDQGNVTKSGFDKTRMSWGEYAASIGPIPLEGPISYVYKKLKEGGASAMDATAIIKGLIIAGVGATGTHVSEEYQSTPAPAGANGRRHR